MSTSYKDHTPEVLAALEKAIENGLTAIGMTAEGHAKKAAPVDTGRLRNSISNQVVTDDKAVYIGTNVEYAPYVELGTSRAKAQPYLKPAATEHTAEYKRIMKAAMKTVE